MKEITIKIEIKKMKELFQKNNYSLKDIKLFLEAKKIMAESLNDEVLLETCKLLEKELETNK